MIARERLTPVFEAFERQTLRGQRLLVHGVTTLAQTHREHVGLDRAMLVNARYELKACELAGVRAAYRARADAAERSAVDLLTFYRIQKIYVRMDIF